MQQIISQKEKRCFLAPAVVANAVVVVVANASAAVVVGNAPAAIVVVVDTAGVSVVA